MPAEILLAPVGAGKTEVALERLAQALVDQPFARVWVLVSGKRQEDAFRQRLAERMTRLWDVPRTGGAIHRDGRFVYARNDGLQDQPGWHAQ